MAKVRKPLHSLDASGSLASLLLFSHSGQENTVRSIAGLRLSATRRANRRPSPAQIANRTSYADRIAQWHAATPQQREAFRPLAVARGWTLFNAWLSLREPTTPPPIATTWDANATTWDGGATTFD